MASSETNTSTIQNKLVLILPAVLFICLVEVVVGFYVYKLIKINVREEFLNQKANGVSKEEIKALLIEEGYLKDICYGIACDQRWYPAGRHRRAIGALPKGPPGPPGPRGLPGPTGARGSTGPAGARGSAGAKGERGANGSMGPKGEKGSIGNSGTVGAKGPVGPPGIPGIHGESGQIGLPGQKGERGDAGTNGKDGVTGGKGEPGVPGSPGKEGHPGAPGRPGIDGKEVKVGSPGQKGEQGVNGLNGQPGQKGNIGFTGDKGEAGLDGEQGKRGEIGPSGEKGDKGAVGVGGQKGQKGELGHQGVEGLKGDKGSHGPFGQPGLPGRSGAAGVQGEKGSIGPQGPPGLQGKGGLLGPRGLPGPCNSCEISYGERNERIIIQTLREETSKVFKTNETECSSFVIGERQVLGNVVDDYAAFMIDSKPISEEAAFKYWSTGRDNLRLNEFDNKQQFNKNEPSKVYDLDVAFDGNAHVIYHGFFFYKMKGNKPKIVKYDLKNEKTQTLLIPDFAKVGRLYLRNYNSFDFSVDQNGVWVIYSIWESGHIAIAKINHESLVIEGMWETSLQHDRAVDMFVASGKMYTLEFTPAYVLRIHLAIDLRSNTTTKVDVDGIHQTGGISMATFDYRNKALLLIDDGIRLIYNIYCEDEEILPVHSY